MRIPVRILCMPLLYATAAQAGVVVHMASKQLPADQPKDHSILYAQDGYLRIDGLDDQGHVRDIQLIRDGVIWMVDVPKRTFRKLDKSAMAAQQSGLQDKMQAMMQNMPPERRAMFEARMKAMQAQTHNYTLSDAGRSERVGSYSCEIWQATRDGKISTEYCVAAKGSIAGGDELVAASHKAAAVATDVMSASPQMSRAISPIYTLYGKMDGFPVLVRHMSGGKAEHEETVTAIERQSLAADKFAIPKGFTEATQDNLGADD